MKTPIQQLIVNWADLIPTLDPKHIKQLKIAQIKEEQELQLAYAIGWEESETMFGNGREYFENRFETELIEKPFELIDEVYSELAIRKPKYTDGIRSIEVQIHFGKNGIGLSKELILIGKMVEKLSKEFHVRIHNAFIDECDDVYSLIFSLTHKCESFDEVIEEHKEI